MKFSRASILALYTAATMTALHPSAWGDAATFGALKDTTIFQNNVNNSSGAGPGLFAGTNGSGSPRRSLIQFDIAGGIPAGGPSPGSRSI